MDNMITPCIGICTLENGECIGCHRSLTDIKCWTHYTNNKRLKIMSENLYKQLEENEEFVKFESRLSELTHFSRQYDEDVKLDIRMYDYEDRKDFDADFTATLGGQEFHIGTSFFDTVEDLDRFMVLCEQFVVNYVNFYEDNA